MLFVSHVFLFYSFFIREFLTRIVSSILMNCYQWGSCLLCETPTNEPMELGVISDFHHRKPHWGSNSGPFDLKLNTLNTRQRIHEIMYSAVQVSWSEEYQKKYPYLVGKKTISRSWYTWLLNIWSVEYAALLPYCIIMLPWIRAK